jgi:transposase
MGRNLIRADRDQLMLMPVDVREWLAEDDIAWQVIEVVDQLDLEEFYARYRIDGHGGAAYDPAVMLAVVIYAHAVEVKSSRKIERALRRDAGFKVVAGQLAPDHTTIHRFVKNHQDAVQSLFVQVLRLCQEAGMVRLGVISVDGTKIAANASWKSAHTGASLDHQIGEQQDLLAAQAAEFEQATGRMLAAQLALDAEEDTEPDADDTPDLPPHLRGRSRRLARLKAAKADLDAREAAARADMLARQKAAQDEYDAKTAAGQRPQGYRPKDEVKYGAAARPRRKGADGRVIDPAAPRASITDPDSRRMKAVKAFLQGYNAQMAVSINQVILGTLICQEATDHHLLPRVLECVRSNLRAAAITRPARKDQVSAFNTPTPTPTECDLEAELVAASQRADQLGVILADAQYANEDTYTAVHQQDLILLAPPSSDETRALGGDPGAGADLSERPGADLAVRRLRTETGKNLYKHRGQSVEPGFGQLKDRGGMRQFTRRGLDAVQAEFTFAAAIHNIRKLLTWTRPTPTPAAAAT